MSDSGDVEVAQSYSALPKEVTEEIGSGIKLFNKWSYEEVEIRDISLTYVHIYLVLEVDIQGRGVPEARSGAKCN